MNKTQISNHVYEWKPAFWISTQLPCSKVCTDEYNIFSFSQMKRLIVLLIIFQYVQKSKISQQERAEIFENGQKLSSLPNVQPAKDQVLAFSF